MLAMHTAIISNCLAGIKSNSIITNKHNTFTTDASAKRYRRGSNILFIYSIRVCKYVYNNVGACIANWLSNSPKNLKIPES